MNHFWGFFNLYNRGRGGGGRAGGASAPHFFEKKYFSIALKNVLTMVNGYTRQFWKELEEPTHREKVNTKKKHYAFRQTTLQVQTSANCWEIIYQLIFIPDVKAMVFSHVGGMKHQNNANVHEFHNL